MMCTKVLRRSFLLIMVMTTIVFGNASMKRRKTKFYQGGTLVTERVEAEGLLTFFSATKFGRLFKTLVDSHLMSRMGGWFMGTRFTKRKIDRFVKKYKINMDQFVVPKTGYKSFNDFFIRKLKPGQRVIDKNPLVLTSPADSKLFVIPEIKPDTTFFIKKGKKFDLQRFLKDDDLVELYKEGTLLLFRLAPNDYHRYHFPCECVPGKSVRVRGSLGTVHPIAYKSGMLPLQENERQIVQLRTRKFGTVTAVIIGARMVGKIFQIYEPGMLRGKGDGMGYFAFGGSSVVLLLEKGIVTVDQKFIDHSQEGYETAVQMGQRIAVIKQLERSRRR